MNPQCDFCENDYDYVFPVKNGPDVLACEQHAPNIPRCKKCLGYLSSTCFCCATCKNPPVDCFCDSDD